VTRPGYAPEHVPTWALREGQTVQDGGRHTIALIEPCRDGRHIVGTDGWETVAGVRHMWTVTR
jgi:hypothetical protein